MSMIDYDVRQTCRTCLGMRKENELVPLHAASDDDVSSDLESPASETNGDLLMECANVEVRL